MNTETYWDTFLISIYDDLVKSQKIPFPVIPAKAGIQCFQAVADHLDSGFHRSDFTNSSYIEYQKSRKRKEESKGQISKNRGELGLKT
jgi:hypothetical protein